jgi:pimeloyl-ACP methyl ester carboxylesterase
MKSFNTHLKKIHKFFVAFACIILWQGCFKFRTSDPKALQQFSEKNIDVTIENYTYADGKNLHYLETGNADSPTVYFIHGTPGSWNNFRNFLQDSQLCKAYRLISLDRPGFGYSNFGKAMGIAAQVELFNQLVKSKNNGLPVVLVGHSLGGPIIAGMAAADSSLFQTLIFLAASVSPEHEPAEKWRKPLAWPVIRWLAPGAMRPSNDEMLDFKTYVKEMPDILQQISCTTYLIHGTKDMFVPYANVAFAENYLTNDVATNIITLENENHFIPWTKFEDLRDLLLYIRNELKN